MGSQPDGRTSADVRASADQNDSGNGTGQNLRTAPQEDIRSIASGSLPTSPVNGYGGTNQDNMRDLAIREKPRVNSNVEGKKVAQRTCKKCGELLTGQFVRALDGTFHLDCFRCQDCGQIVASKFFPVDDETGHHQYPLCETDYFRRLDLLCFNCGGALRGSYVTALNRKYHIDHFTCSVCPTTFGAKDSYYEHDGDVFCHYHYSTRFAQRCNGCQTAILKQFVEIFRNGQNQHWHPECYMIHKFWNVRLAGGVVETVEASDQEDDATEERRTQIREQEEQMEDRVYRIWSTLSAFEESSAACISDMLLHVSNGTYVDGVVVAKRFIRHVDYLFRATDRLDECIVSRGLNGNYLAPMNDFQAFLTQSSGLSYGREAKLLCKKIVAFFSLLSKTQDSGVRRLGVTQELLSLVTGLAHYLKLLIRISLQGALKLERETGHTDGLHEFLDILGHLESIKDSDNSLEYLDGSSGLAAEEADLCYQCHDPTDDECLEVGARRWHMKHLQCDYCNRDIGDELGVEDATWSEREKKAWCPKCTANNFQAIDAATGIEHKSRLQQYTYLLRVALARLLSVLRQGGSLPHTSDDPNLTSYDSNEGHRVMSHGIEPSMLSPETRSKSYGGTSTNDQIGSSYEQTVGEMKRLRSTRMDKTLSTTIHRARTSRIIDGPNGQGMNLNGLSQNNGGFHIVEDRDSNGEARTDLTFGHQDALTLDDIPRIVAAEQAKEQRPNAYKHARNQLISSGRQPKLLSGHQRDFAGSGGNEGVSSSDYPVQRTKRYFSELSGLEYFNVRHIAVLQMEPLLEGHFNLEDLLGLIEPKRPTFWGKFGRAFKNDKARGGKKKGVFGVGLDVLVEKDGVESTDGVGPGGLKVPSLLDDTISAMRQMDMSVEGVFRKNGNIRGLKDLAEKIDAKDGECDLSKESPVQVAALLKKFLRELPDPLLTFKLHDLFTTSQKIADEEKRKRVLHLTCCLLPKSHRDSVEILFSFLNWAASFSQVDEETGSKMDTHNLATVIAPNILYLDSKEPGIDQSFLAIEAVHMLIDYNDQMCEVPEDIQSILNDSEVFQTNSDITTKEILKRYGDIVKDKKGSGGNGDDPDLTPMRSQESNGNSSGNTRVGAPVVTRVDTDPHQVHAWQKESSVRHVVGNGGHTYTSGSNQNTPPQHHFDFSNPSSPYHQRAGSTDSAASYGTPNRHSHRPSGWSKNSTPGPMGVTGAV
ncbi:hypothetical protein MMC17_001547 [Xylographa soralifera]|nr:hypothetical protein [Xylographa soralifera]